MGTSLLATDGYKFSMAEAGWPLRKETFYYTHRKGGLQIVPMDIPTFVRGLLPEPRPEDEAPLAMAMIASVTPSTCGTSAAPGSRGSRS